MNGDLEEIKLEFDKENSSELLYKKDKIVCEVIDVTSLESIPDNDAKCKNDTSSGHCSTENMKYDMEELKEISINDDPKANETLINGNGTMWVAKSDTKTVEETDGASLSATDPSFVQDLENKMIEKEDINGNSSFQLDKNLMRKERSSSTSSRDSVDSKSSLGGRKRKTRIPTSLPLNGRARTGSNSSTGSPSSPTRRFISDDGKLPPSPGLSRKPPNLPTPDKGEKSSATSKPTLERKASKSKLPVSNAKSPSTPTKPIDAAVEKSQSSSIIVSQTSESTSTGSSSKPATPTSPKMVTSTPMKISSSSTTTNKAGTNADMSPGTRAASPLVKTYTGKDGTGPLTGVSPVKPELNASSTPNTPLNFQTTPAKDGSSSTAKMTPRRLQDEQGLWKEKVKKYQELKEAMAELNLDPKSRFLRCLFCTHHFTLNGREPRMLVCCLNAICSACASKLCPEGPSHLRCPVCRQNILLPPDRTCDSIDLNDESVVDGGQLDLPTEVVRTKILEFQHIQKGLTFPCSCPGKHMSTWFCENCDSYMCDTCRDEHKENTKSKRHSTIAVPNLKARQLRDFKAHHYCKEHSHAKLTLYCTTCRQVVCNTCTRDGHERDSHTVMSIQEAFGVKIKQAGKLLSKAKKKHRHLTEYSKTLKAKSDCNEVSSSSAKDTINSTFDHIIDVLQRRRTELLTEVDQQTAFLSASATVDTDSADCRLSMINTASDYTKEFKSKADSVEFLQLFPTVSETLRSVLDFSNDNVNTSRQGVTFNPWNLKLAEKLLKTAGQLRVVTYKPTGRPGRQEVSQKPALHPSGHDLATTTTISDPAQGTVDLVCQPDERVIRIPSSEKRGSFEIRCPKLEFDHQTVHSDRTLTHDTGMVNHAPEHPLSNTGCRLRSYPGAMADTALDGSGFMLWGVRSKVHIKQRVPDNKMLFEAALTGTPVDAPLSQRIDTSLVLAGCDLHHELCIKVKYCCKNLAHFSGCKNAAGTHADFHFGMLLDLDRRRLHVLNLATNTVIAKAERINVHRPLWAMYCVGRFTFADVKLNLETADKVKVTPELFSLLSGIIDQERLT